jgi:hypothetical protein
MRGVGWSTDPVDSSNVADSSNLVNPSTSLMTFLFGLVRRGVEVALRAALVLRSS